MQVVAMFAKGVFGIIGMAVGHIDCNLANRAAAKEPDPNEKARALVNYYKAVGYGDDRAMELAFGEVYGK